ncbi:MAG: flagellar biosynthetic protein FliO [Oscillospiraceae bacterium]|nr:flagellar biosynthetic protein FliO [Oscillospiraceae bacterium]
MPGESGLLSLLWVLLCVLVIVGAAYWFTKHVVGQRLGGRIGLGRTDGLRVLTRAQLGRDQSLLVVQAGERYFLLGAAPSGITLLAEFTQEEAEAWKPQDPPADAPPSFQEALKTVIRGKMKR